MGFSEEEYEQLKANLSGKTKFKKSKYRNKPTRFRGRTYDSKFECEWAVKYHMLLRAGELRGVIPQPIVDLAPHREEGEYYRPDFQLIRKDGSVIFVEIKGVETDKFKKVRGEWSDHGPSELHIIKRGKDVEILPQGRYVNTKGD